MSRGPGSLQRRVLETLADYQRLGRDLRWTWQSTHPAGSIAGKDDIRAYEQGRRVPLWILRRDLACTAAELSRALTSLERHGLVTRFDWDLIALFDRQFAAKNAKFATITTEGLDWLKRQQMHNGKVGAYRRLAA